MFSCCKGLRQMIADAPPGSKIRASSTAVVAGSKGEVGTILNRFGTVPICGWATGLGVESEFF